MQNQVYPTDKTVRTVCSILQSQYLISSLGNKSNPLDEYLYILLSLRTHEKGTKSAYRAFKKHYPSWSAAEKASPMELSKVITCAGLSKQKANNIYKTLKYLKSEFGSVSMAKLKNLPKDEVERYLLHLPGVGLKSAKCIMMFSFGFNVLPVDVHVFRLSSRLGWCNCGKSKDAHVLMSKIVPKDLYYSFHVLCVQHGRNVCRGHHPSCEYCCISGYCKFQKS
ncbi:endonuclease III [Desulfosalsimonas propionicica]|uniref:Endonuclease III n=1 Tax=Desulfosalsimonas propionicica TaxID=332175 RepID=A0A7W0CAD7_9BACT|nr:endonuclease III [Desulfosalsimonas propionicica]